jgi:hypothetical protein
MPASIEELGASVLHDLELVGDESTETGGVKGNNSDNMATRASLAPPKFQMFGQV